MRNDKKDDVFDRMFLGHAGKFTFILLVLVILYIVWDIYF